MAAAEPPTGAPDVAAAVLSPTRLAAVRASGLLDSGPEEAFDRLTRLAAQLLGAPYAFVTAVDERRSFWKSCVGVDSADLGERQNTVAESFCQYVIGSGRPLVVDDARVDARTSRNPSVAALGVQAWIGYPVRDSAAEVLGTFCVVDTRPRSWTSRDQQVVETLAHAAANEIALRRALEQVRSEAERAVHLQQQRYEVLVAQAPVGIFLAEPDGAHAYANDRLAELVGRAPEELAGQGWLEHVHPADRAGVAASWAEMLEHAGGWCEEFRVVRPDGTERWVAASARTLRDPDGVVTGFLGTSTDVTERREVEQARRTAAAELAARREADTAAARLHGLSRATVEINDARSVAAALQVLARTAREVVGAHQAAVSVTVDGNGSQWISAVSLSDRYAAWRHYDTPPDQTGIYATVVRENAPMRLTQAELENHPAWRGFGPEADRHPPMRGWLAVPLTASDQGNLGLVQLSDRDAGEFTSDDEAVLTQLAEIGSAVLEKARLLERERETNRRLELMQRATAALSAAATPTAVAAAATDQFAQLLGTVGVAVWELRDTGSVEAILLPGWTRSARDEWGSVSLDADMPIAAVARRQQAVWLERPEDWERDYPHLIEPARRYGYVSVACLPLLVGGRCVGVLAVGFGGERRLDTTERAAARSLAEQCAQALHRAGLLAVESEARRAAEELSDVVAALSGATSPAEVAEVILGHAGELGADGCVVLRRRDHLAVLATTGAGARAGTAAGAAAGADLVRLPLDAAHPLAEAVRTARPGWHATVPAPPGTGPALPAQIAVPLVLAGTTIGAIGLHFGEDPPVLSPGRRDTILTIAGQCAQALDRARLQQAEHELAETLQQSLLPPALPELDRLGLAARYLPAAWGSQAGGDWYDVLPLDDDRVAIVVGDVVGQGPTAAAVMGQLRSALAAYLLQGHSPAESLQWLDRFSRRVQGARASTALCLVLHTGTGEIRWARAGHPPPLVIGTGGAHFLDGGHGTVLGVLDAPPYTEADAVLAPGSSVLLYTDGLVERRGEVIDAGFDRLAAVAAPHSAAPPDALIRAVLDGAVDGAGRADDIAVLVARLRPAPLERRHRATPDQLAPARRAVREWAAAAGLSEELTDDLLLAIGEAVANSVEHAYPARSPGSVTYRIEQLGTGQVQVEVRDDGTWRPVPADSGYRGRGLTLIRELGHDVAVRTAGPGTLVRFRLAEPTGS